MLDEIDDFILEEDFNLDEHSDSEMALTAPDFFNLVVKLLRITSMENLKTFIDSLDFPKTVANEYQENAVAFSSK